MATHNLIDFNGLPAIRLTATDGASAVVTLHGAHTVSWTTSDGQEQLYLSERSPFASTAAIRGGIPIVFPQFSNMGPLPRHGFARTSTWQLEQVHEGGDFVGATFFLEDSDETRRLWPHQFRAEATLCVARNRLDFEFSVCNRGSAAFAFNAALHTYLRVAHIETVELMGLQGCTFRDQVAGKAERVEKRPEISFDQEVDRIYLTAPQDVMLREPGRSINIIGSQFPDLVVWNPWVDKCAMLPDMPPDGFKRMLCVEAAIVEQPINLAPDAEWWGRQSLVVL